MPFGFFADKLFPPTRSEAIVTRALAFVGQLPGSSDPAVRFEPVKGRVKRAGFNLKQVFGSPLNMFGDGVAVAGARGQGAEDEQVEGTSEEIHARQVFGVHCVGSLPNVV